MIHARDHRVALRWLGVLLMFGSLIVLAALPRATGLGGAALCWIAAFLLFEMTDGQPTSLPERAPRS